MDDPMIRVAAILAGLIGITWIMILGRSIIIPIFLAFFLWGGISSLTARVGYYRIFGRTMPLMVARIIVFVFVIIAISLIGLLFYNEFYAVVNYLPAHRENLELILSNLPTGLWRILPVSMEINISTILDDLIVALGELMSSYASVVAGNVLAIIGQLFLVMLYVLFLLGEENTFSQKIQALFPDSSKAAETEHIISSIWKTVQKYISVKTYVSLITALLSFTAMWLFGLEHRTAWALLIFLLNFIPNIGSIIAVLFPSFTALVQFGSIGATIPIVLSLIAIQLMIGMFLEPLWTGNSLNISPFVVLVSLTFFGTIWGITGAFFSVPIAIMVMIVTAHFPATRGIAVILSKDGDISTLTHEYHVQDQ